jgi:hypothetical protein
MIRLNNRMSIALGAVLIIGSSVFFFYPAYQSHVAFVNSQYGFKVEAIEFRPGHHGVPHIKVDTGWYLLRTTEELNIVPYLKVSDSLVKVKGTAGLIIYRRDKTGRLTPETYD